MKLALHNLLNNFILYQQLSDDQDMKGAAGRRSQSPIDPSQYFSSIDSQRGTPVGASDDESTSRSNGIPHSVVQMADESIPINDNSYLKRSDSLQGLLLAFHIIVAFVIIGEPENKASTELLASTYYYILIKFGLLLILTFLGLTYLIALFWHGLHRMKEIFMILGFINCLMSLGILGGQAARKTSKATDNTKVSAAFDHDENKYKQKSTFAWISRWLK